MEYEETTGSNSLYSSANTATIQVNPQLPVENTFISWQKQVAPGDLVSGLMIRYRREHALEGSHPFLAGAANEAPTSEGLGDGVFPLILTDQSNRNLLLTDNQWQIGYWRRGAFEPLAGVDEAAAFVSPEDPAGSDSDIWLGTFLAPDTDPCPTEPTGPCDGYPLTYIDFLRVWTAPRPTAPEPVYEVAAVVVNLGGFWVSVPEQLRYTVGGFPLGVSVVNNGGDAQGAVLFSATIDIQMLGKAPTRSSGSTYLQLATGETGIIPMGSNWPAPVGLWRLDGNATLGGVSVSEGVSRSVDVFEPPDLEISGVQARPLGGTWQELVEGAPNEFPPGYPIEFSVEVSNRGSLPLGGTYHIHVHVMATPDTVTSPQFDGYVSVPAAVDGEPGLMMFTLSPSWVAPGGGAGLQFSLRVDSTFFDFRHFSITAPGCPVPYVTLP